ncbi:ATP-dependent DNA helicase, RecD/TraA family [Granulicatella balaenopterae]|uniref:ATP-dependent RecD2 DNA helicase n=1 Tax=Granulicatella balaenopterae TaxID=137733 RepID=A0A1H9MTN3_9LACT|nr:ATP-dependent RecD-like DNA helicase [Granulicatella balaenopterae]SER27076.1 ATP-dependent DNA helicase, RecD/TraA family [Granulicatella balaenopterae]
MTQSEEPYITGAVMTFFYENPSNYYKVMLIKIDETNTEFENDEIVVTGVFGQIHQDVPYRFKGRLVSHPKYGQQFSVTSYSQDQPTGELGLVRYLSSEKFPGVGEKTAKRMVREIGLGVIDKIIADKECLKGITGLTPKKRQQIHDTLVASQGTEKTLIALSNLGFSANLAQKIMNKYKDKTMEILEENPYLFVRDVEGVGFKRIDAVAKDIGIAPDNPNRMAGAVFVVVRDICYQNGNTYLLDKEVLVLAQKLLESSQAFLVEYDQIVEGMNELLREGALIADEDKIALSSLYFSEIGISSSIDRLQRNAKDLKIDIDHINEAIAKVEELDGIKYDEVQRKAIEEIIQSPMYILTGGPGTGKTTIIKGVVEVYKMIHKKKVVELIKRDEDPVKLAAPTGRAAKRMSEVTHLPASTIHRLLGLTADDNGFMSAEEPTEISDVLLIVDEMSMIDTWLMNRLLKSITCTTQILFVGDKHQLPSVGPGQVLDDLLESKKIPSIELTQIHRQKDGSTIVELAHQMNRGSLPTDFKQGKRDRSFIPCQPNQIVTVIEQVVEKAMLKGFDKRDIQVLAPMYRGEAGIDAINTIMQNIMNPIIGKTKREVEFFERKFRVGDKVLQLVNRAEFSVYNGDIGEITAIEYAKENEEKVDKIFVAFDQVEMEYPRSDWNQLTLAYCCSIHKAQGSEFKLVILPMVHQYSRMLRRNLLYTAVTRSKELLIMCGQESAFHEAVASESDRRKTQLMTFLTEERTTKESEKDLETSLTNEETDDIQTQITDEKINNNQKDTEKSTTETTKKDNHEQDTMGMISTEEIVDVVTEKLDDGILTLEKVINQMIDPMIGMGNQTPYDFMK